MRPAAAPLIMRMRGYIRGVATLRIYPYIAIQLVVDFAHIYWWPIFFVISRTQDAKDNFTLGDFQPMPPMLLLTN